MEHDNLTFSQSGTASLAPARREAPRPRHGYHGQPADLQNAAKDAFFAHRERQWSRLLSAGLSDEEADSELARLAAGEVWGG